MYLKQNNFTQSIKNTQRMIDFYQHPRHYNGVVFTGYVTGIWAISYKEIRENYLYEITQSLENNNVMEIDFTNDVERFLSRINYIGI